MALSYFINRKKSTCVITFKGSLSPNDSDLLGNCLKEATADQFRYVILNMGGVRDADPDASRAFTIFQQGIRASSKLYLCDVPSETARILKTLGVLRESEMHPDLMTCLQAIINSERGKG